MVSKPKFVAISQRVNVVPEYGETRDCLDQSWSRWLESMNIVAVPIPNRFETVAAYITALPISGIMLTGGNNFFDPVYEDGVPPVGDAYESRDHTEFRLVEIALSRRLPLLCWCRGMQVLQVFFGGKLDVTGVGPVRHVAAFHDVVITDTRFSKLTGEERFEVNSFHDYGVRVGNVATELLTFAVSPDDDVVEGIYHPHYPVVGVQWHPERTNRCDQFNRALVQCVMGQGGDW